VAAKRSEENGGYAMPAIEARLKDLLDETRLAMLITIQVAEMAHMISPEYPLKVATNISRLKTNVHMLTKPFALEAL
jgi:hypothetical protein